MSEGVVERSVESWEVPEDERLLDDPLLECLVFLTKHHQRPLSANALRAGLPLVEHRLTPKLFLRAAERAGLSSRVVKRSLKSISPLVLPAVLLLEGHRACVLLGLDAALRRARIAQPEARMGESEVDVKDLEKQYIGYAIFAKPEHLFDKRADEAVDLPERNWFWATIFSSWRIYRDVLVASFLVNVFALATPLFVMNVYDRVVPNNAVETLWVLALGVVIVYGFDLLMRGLRGYLIDLAGKKADVVLSSMIFEKVMGLRMDSRPKSVGAFANSLREFDSVRDFFTSATISAVIDLPFVLMFVGVIWMIGGPVAVIPMLGIPAIAIYGLVVQVPLRKAVEQVFRMSSEKNATLVESLTAVETVKALGAESPLQRKWEHASGHVAKWGIRSRLLSSSASNVAVFVQQLCIVGVVVFGVYQIGQGVLSLGGLIGCVILTGRAMAPMAQIANLATRDYQARAALRSLHSIMALPVERPRGKKFLHRPRLEGAVAFHGVSFSYPGQEIRALDGVSFQVKPGEHVGIIGRIGSGKTTIQKLILGLYEPSDGAVRVGGTDVRQIDPADLRRNIGYMPQDILLFHGSLRDNITFGAPFVDDQTVLKVSQIAGVNTFADLHPRGFDMQVGERGEGLSGGQRQVVAIARALLLSPPILVMDEPSNSMDNNSEQQLKGRLIEYLEGRTLILVTHRASLLDLVDRLIVMDAGKVVADGPKEQIMELLKQGKLRVAR